MGTFQAKYPDTGSINQQNIWNQNQQGNYYNNYMGTDTNKDGIGDDPNIIKNQTLGNYPIINPVNINQIPKPKTNP